MTNQPLSLWQISYSYLTVKENNTITVQTVKFNEQNELIDNYDNICYQKCINN